ncbi:MAG TPA: DUF4124 domain-containing protein [Methylibium sp.]|nr:DUF4124 domain-containing protein [Methylibium sp.]
MSVRSRASFRGRVGCLALLLVGVGGIAQAQWQWRDERGQMQYSDLPPPRGTPAKNIIQQPTMIVRQAAAAPAPGPASAASAPGSVDPALEQRRKEQERVEAERRKADQLRVAEQRSQQQAQNCEQARAQLRLMESGERVVRTSPRGERVYLDDNGRAAEAAAARQVIASECR